MRKKSLKNLAIGLVAIILLLPSLTASVAAQAAPKGPYVDKIIYFQLPSDEEAITKIQTGEAHMRWWGLRTIEAVKKAQEAGLNILESPSGAYDILVNPVPFREGFNPFTISEIREALNYLIDRSFIANEILKGLAVPRWTLHRSFSPDYARNIVFMKSLESKYAYDFDKAKMIIFESMGKAGATFEEGKWMYNGKPVVIKFSIRVEDLRRAIGDYISSQLEKVGFTVERMYQRAAVAFGIVYSGNPADGAWNLYTEGWAYTGISAYEDTDAYFYYVSPGTDAVHTVYKPSPLLVDVATKLNEGKYADLDERSGLVRSANELALKDSVRIFLVDQLEAFPYSKTLQIGVSDLYAGPYGVLFGRSMRFVDKVGGEAKIGSRVMFVSSYLAMPGSGGGTDIGFNWLFDGLVFNNLFDPGVWVHPHTGRYMPIRTTFNVQTGGVKVPEDALTWSWEQGKWVAVGKNVTAKSKVTFTATLGKWHDGANVGKEDIMMFIYEILGIATPGSPIHDPAAISPAVQTFTNTFKGVKWLSDNVYEIYLDYTHPDETFIAAQADVFPFMPWQVYALVNALYQDKKAAFSETTATELGVTQIDLTKGDTLPLLKEYFSKMAPSYIHPAVKDFVKDASSRWNSLKAFSDKYGHYLVMSGPFFIERVDPVAAQVILAAFRDYPYTADKWDYLLKPRVPTIGVEVPNEVVPGLPALINVTSRVEGKPYSDVNVQYVLEDPNGVVVESGLASAKGAGVFTVEFSKEVTSKLTSGIYKLTIIGVGAEAALAAVKTAPINVIPQLEYILREVGGVREDISKKLESEITSVQESISKKLESEITSVQGGISKQLESVQAGIADALKTVAVGVDKMGTSLTESVKVVATGLDKTNTAVTEVRTALSDVKSAVADLKSTQTTSSQRLESSIASLEDSINSLTSSILQISTYVTIAIGVAVVAIVVAIVVPLAVLRSRKTG
ncbi:MAG: ABC transporter substrate-binding protein [Nitrososphaerales archaeon]